MKKVDFFVIDRFDCRVWRVINLSFVEYGCDGDNLGVSVIVIVRVIVSVIMVIVVVVSVIDLGVISMSIIIYGRILCIIYCSIAITPPLPTSY